MEHDECVARVRACLEGLPCGHGPDHGCASGPNAAIYGSDSTSLVYGEITWAGMETLHNALNLRSDDVFYDLGSGVGKFVLCTALRACWLGRIGHVPCEQRLTC